MKRQWKIQEVDETKLVEMPEYPPLIVKLLALRGLTNPEAITEFLEPDFSRLNDPFLFGQMHKAVQRIRQAVETDEQITIYADYDADAITAAAVVFQSLKKLGGLVDCYIPDRFSEGYGVNAEAITKIADQGSKLIITVDCGTNSVEEAKLAHSLDVDLIITDHHEVTGKLPEAFALINPKNPEDLYPYPYLTGVGVAYKLVQALFSAPRLADARSGQPSVPDGWEKWLLDYVAIGTVADCQNLTLENRILVGFGLKVLAKTRWPGLKALLDIAGVKKLDAFALGFVLAPRINAAGRIKHADLAFKLLVSDNIAEAAALALELNDLNKHRQILTGQLLSEAREQIALISDKKVLLASLSGSAKQRLGVVGLVAGKLLEEFGRPVLVLEKGEQLAHGSARSVADFDLVAALTYAKDLLQRYGGHTQAAGFTLHNDNIPAFHQKLLEYAENTNAEFGEPVLEVDSELSEHDINWENYDYMARMAPFGVGNPKPKFVSYDLDVVSSRIVGSDGRHLKLQLKMGQKYLNAIAFGQGFLAQSLTPGKKLDVVYQLEANEWNGNKEMQLKILDIKA